MKDRAVDADYTGIEDFRRCVVVDYLKYPWPLMSYSEIGASIGVGDDDDVMLGRMPDSLVKDGDLALSDEASKLTRSTGS